MTGRGQPIDPATPEVAMRVAGVMRAIDEGLNPAEILAVDFESGSDLTTLLAGWIDLATTLARIVSTASGEPVARIVDEWSAMCIASYYNRTTESGDGHPP